MTLPIPTLDHVVVNVRDRMDEAEAVYRRLGFTLTPRGYHTLGSINHLAIFGTDYLELIGARSDDPGRRDILGWPLGLNGLVFGTEDSASTHAALAAAGVPILPPVEFSRPVETPDGTVRDATFRTVRLPHEAVPAGRLYFCHHFTRDLVWRDAWRHHANGTVGVACAIIAAREPAAMGGLFRSMFGTDAVSTIPHGLRLCVGLSRFDVVIPQAVEAAYGDAAADPAGRDTWMAALVLRTRSTEAARRALQHGAIAVAAGRAGFGAGIVVPAMSAFGVILEFVD